MKAILLYFRIFAAAIVLAVSPVSAFATDADGQYSVFSFGIQSCGAVIDAYNKDTAVYVHMETWVAGYASALGLWKDTEKSFNDVSDIQGMMLIIRQHCEKNPFDKLLNAAEHLSGELLDKAGRRTSDASPLSWFVENFLLLSSAEKGDIAEIKRLLADGANPNAADKDGYTALMRAAREGHAEVAKTLLSAGANPNAKYMGKLTALMVAALNGHAEVVKILLSAGANPNTDKDGGFPALMWAAQWGHVKIVEVLLSAGANPNMVLNDGKTALMYMALEGHAEIVQILLSAGADPNVENNDGETALMIAIEFGNVEVVRVLEETGAK